MSDHPVVAPEINIDTLREAIQKEYAEVAANPEEGFHFHTGRPLACILEYEDEWLVGIPESSIESFAGTGNPFSLGEILPGEKVVDIGCGAGIYSLIAAKMVGPTASSTRGPGMSTSKIRRGVRQARFRERSSSRSKNLTT